MKVEFHPQTVVDLNQAVDYFEEKRKGLGNELREEILLTIGFIEIAPKRFRVVENGIRRYFVHRFPYSILFKVVEPETIRVLVIRHHRQRSNYGIGRT